MGLNGAQTSAAAPCLATHRLTVGYWQGRRRATPVLEDVNVAMRPGTLSALIGPNGAGKSTLLRTLASAQRPVAGEIRLDGVPTALLSSRERARRLAIVTTDQLHAGLLTGRELVALGRHPHISWMGRLAASDHECVRWALDATGATPLADRQVATLSDGERQRVLVARALAQGRRVLLLDEPTAFLDVPRRIELLLLMRRLAHETGLAVLVSTHDLELALRLADHVWLITPDGHIEEGLPEVVARTPQFSASFASPGIRFDADSATFQLEHAATRTLRFAARPSRTVELVVERLGYRILPDAADGDALDRCIHVEEVHDANGTRWTVRSTTGATTVATLDELVTTLAEPPSVQAGTHHPNATQASDCQV